MQIVIETVNLRKIFYPNTAAAISAVDGIDIVIERGEFVAIMGASGSGKSTLLNLLGCLDSPTEGQYKCCGTDVTTLSSSQRARLRSNSIGFVFQNFSLLHNLSVISNVALPLIYTPVVQARHEELAMEALTLVGLSNRASNFPQELSGGQQQRVAIARALINRPAILLADEPTGALDSASTDDILQLMESLGRDGCTIVMITHDRDVAHRAARVENMQDGRLCTGGRAS